MSQPQKPSKKHKTSELAGLESKKDNPTKIPTNSSVSSTDAQASSRSTDASASFTPSTNVTSASSIQSAGILDTKKESQETKEERGRQIAKIIEESRKLTREELTACLLENGFEMFGKSKPYDNDDDLIYERTGTLP